MCKSERPLLTCSCRSEPEHENGCRHNLKIDDIPCVSNEKVLVLTSIGISTLRVRGCMDLVGRPIRIFFMKNTWDFVLLPYLSVMGWRRPFSYSGQSDLHENVNKGLPDLYTDPFIEH